MRAFDKMEEYFERGKYGDIALLAFLFSTVVLAAVGTLLLHRYAPNFCGYIAQN